MEKLLIHNYYITPLQCINLDNTSEHCLILGKTFILRYHNGHMEQTGIIMALVCIQYPDGGIGLDNDLIWKGLKGDMSGFKKKTTGNVVVMGNGTFKSMNSNPLPDRINIVITRNPDQLNNSDIVAVSSPIKALEIAQNNWPEKDICIMGGAQIYEDLFPYCEKLYVTEVHGDKPSDRQLHIPEYFTEVARERGPDETIEYYFVEYKNTQLQKIG